MCIKKSTCCDPLLVTPFITETHLEPLLGISFLIAFLHTLTAYLCNTALWTAVNLSNIYDVLAFLKNQFYYFWEFTKLIDV